MSLYILKLIYFSYVHSVVSYGIIFGGNSHHSDSIFNIQKRIIRIITNTGRRDSCLQLYKLLYAQYVQYVQYVQYAEYVDCVQYAQYIQYVQCIQYAQYVQYAE
jgi:hypothetical protein